MRSAAWFVVRRLAGAAVTVFFACVVIFTVLRLVPGSYADIVLGPYSTAELRAQAVAHYGLDRPLPEQFLRWLAGLFQGDLGFSMISRLPVGSVIAERLPVNLELAALAGLMALAVGVPLGVVSALRATRRAVAGAGRLAGAMGLSVPDFVLGSVLVLVFSSVSLGLPVNGYVPFTGDPGGNLRAMALPATTLGVFVTALTLRTTRDAVLGVLTEPYVTAAFARGESRARIVRHHLLRNAAIPVVTVLFTNVAYIAGGAVVVERIFTLPGLGDVLFGAITNRDYAVVQGVVLLAAVLFVTLNTLTDLVYALLDPRVAPNGGS